MTYHSTWHRPPHGFRRRNPQSEDMQAAEVVTRDQQVAIRAYGTTTDRNLGSSGGVPGTSSMLFGPAIAVGNLAEITNQQSPISNPQSSIAPLHSPLSTHYSALTTPHVSPASYARALRLRSARPRCRPIRLLRWIKSSNVTHPFSG